MVTIFTGEINSGKTTKMENYYSSNRIGDGFFCKKAFDGKTHIGYDLIRISTNKALPFIRKKTSLNRSQNIIFATKKYIFFRDTFTKVENILNNLIDKNISPIYIDEIGKLELQKRCFYNSIEKILDKNISLITSIRSSCLEEAIDIFNLKEDELCII